MDRFYECLEVFLSHIRNKKGRLSVGFLQVAGGEYVDSPTPTDCREGKFMVRSLKTLLDLYIYL